MHNPRSIANAYLIESDVDIQTARMAYINSIYSRSIYFAQQSAEKIVKACLALEIVYTTDHNTSAVFMAVFKNDIPKIDKVIQSITELEKLGSKARFPLFQREDLPIWIPSRGYGEKEAMDALEKGEAVFRLLRDFLKDRFSVG